MNVTVTWMEVYERCKGTCVICGVTEQEGTPLGVVSIFIERKLTEHATNHEFVLMCYTDRELLMQYHDLSLHRDHPIIKKYLRLRGDIAQRIHEERTARTNTRSTQTTSRGRFPRPL